MPKISVILRDPLKEKKREFPISIVSELLHLEKANKSRYVDLSICFTEIVEIPHFKVKFVLKIVDNPDVEVLLDYINITRIYKFLSIWWF